MRKGIKRGGSGKKEGGQGVSDKTAIPFLSSRTEEGRIGGGRASRRRRLSALPVTAAAGVRGKREMQP
jgi:hypothetical protein